MTHHLLAELATQRHATLATQAGRERHTAPTRPTTGTARRRRSARGLSALAAIVNRA
jgi:hypothetical protein